MKVQDYEFELDGRFVRFYHNQKTHRYEIVTDDGDIEFSKAKGEAVAEFLKFFVTESNTREP